MTIYKNVVNYVETPDGVERVEENVNDILARKGNQYRGWLCWSGINTLGIGPDGNVYNADCRCRLYGNIYEDEKIEIPDKPIVCSKTWCACAANLNVRKVKNRTYTKYMRPVDES